MPEPLRLLLVGPPPDQPLTRLRPQTLQLLIPPTVPPAPPLHPSVSWVASVANLGTRAGWPMGGPGLEAQPYLALLMKAAPALVWGPHQMYLGAPWLAQSPQGPGHVAGWTRSRTENPHASPPHGAPAAHLDPQSLEPGTACTPSVQELSLIPGCDGAAQMPPGPHSFSFSFVALTPLHQGAPQPPASWVPDLMGPDPLGPHGTMGPLLYIPVGG